MLCALGSFVEQRSQLIAEHGDLPGFLALLVDVLRNPSLVVSVPVLFIWTKLLALRSGYISEEMSRQVEVLLEICSGRLVRYESFPADSSDPTYLFLGEDFDTMPERHAFLGNYRRFCQSVIESIVWRTPMDALQHILAQATTLLENVSRQERPFNGMSQDVASLNFSTILTDWKRMPTIVVQCRYSKSTRKFWSL